MVREVSVSSWKTDIGGASFAADVILDCAERVRGPASVLDCGA